jgi:hypothetical protein
MTITPLDPELRDSIRNRLRLCLICRHLKQWSRGFHNQLPETYDRVHARHRLIQKQLARMRKARRIVRAAQDRDGTCILIPPWFLRRVMPTPTPPFSNPQLEAALERWKRAAEGQGAAPTRLIGFVGAVESNHLNHLSVNSSAPSRTLPTDWGFSRLLARKRAALLNSSIGKRPDQLGPLSQLSKLAQPVPRMPWDAPW